MNRSMTDPWTETDVVLADINECLSLRHGNEQTGEMESCAELGLHITWGVDETHARFPM